MIFFRQFLLQLIHAIKLLCVPGGDFFLEAVISNLLNGRNDFFDFGGGNGPLVASGDNAIANFLGIKKLPGIILLNHQQLLHFHLFIGGEPTAAIDAFTAAANGVSVVSGAGIDHTAIGTIAKLTFHECFNLFSHDRQNTLYPIRKYLSIILKRKCNIFLIFLKKKRKRKPR